MQFTWEQTADIVNELAHIETYSLDQDDITRMNELLDNNPNSKFYFVPYGGGSSFKSKDNIVRYYNYYSVFMKNIDFNYITYFLT